MDPIGVLQDEEIIELLMKAGLEDVLARYKENENAGDGKDGKPKNGLDYVITENGSNLSSGER
jgi:ABC-type multidrug transport system fused ATPase/permease subunit